MDKYILTLFLINETVSLSIIEPFHCSLCQTRIRFYLSVTPESIFYLTRFLNENDDHLRTGVEKGIDSATIVNKTISAVSI